MDAHCEKKSIPERRVKHRGVAAVFVCVLAGCFNTKACASQAGGHCDPRNFECPKSYNCSLAEVCTKACEQTSDCWVKFADGCISTNLPGMRLPDGGVFMEMMSEDGFCPESKQIVCLNKFCQQEVCVDGGCNYDIYGPSEFKGNRSQGPPP
jgi:hypothetical protein